jgi:hypothetical protein
MLWRRSCNGVAQALHRTGVCVVVVGLLQWCCAPVERYVVRQQSLHQVVKAAVQKVVLDVHARGLEDGCRGGSGSVKEPAYKTLIRKEGLLSDQNRSEAALLLCQGRASPSIRLPQYEDR